MSKRYAEVPAEFGLGDDELETWQRSGRPSPEPLASRG
jgi:hypothetical protein